MLSPSQALDKPQPSLSQAKPSLSQAIVKRPKLPFTKAPASLSKAWGSLDQTQHNAVGAAFYYISSERVTVLSV